MECLSYCIADSIDLLRLDNHYKSNQADLSCIRLRELIKIKHKTKPQTIFVLKNGTVVSWGVKRYQIKSYLDTILNFSQKPISLPIHDEFHFTYGEKTTIEPHGYFDVDCLQLDSNEDELLLSLSYGFSQSVKLQYFETRIDGLIEKYTPLIHRISVKGQVKINRNSIRRIIGEILMTKTEMNLISNFLYHPKYFWQHPNLEEHYTMLERYLHIPKRVNAINHRLNTLNEIFEMFSQYLENSHAHFLEIIIIVLIAIEIVFGVLNFHF